MGKAASGLAVEFNDVLNTECAQELGNDYTAYRVDSINRYSEISLGYGLGVNKLKSLDHIDRLAVVGVVGIGSADFISRGKTV